MSWNFWDRENPFANSPFEDETTDEQWGKIRQLADKGNCEKLFDFLVDLGTIDPRAANLFILATQEHRRLAALVEAGSGATAKVGELQRELEFALRSAQTTDPETARKRCVEIETSLAETKNAAEQARIANIYRTGIERRFPRLFGLGPVEVNGVRHWPPVVDAPSPAIHEELHRLMLPGDTINPHEYFPAIALPTKPAKRVVSPLTAGVDEDDS